MCDKETTANIQVKGKFMFAFLSFQYMHMENEIVSQSASKTSVQPSYKHSQAFTLIHILLI